VTFGGHFGAVCDLCWDPKGAFLISTSADQTTRLHAHWQAENSAEVCLFFSILSKVIFNSYFSVAIKIVSKLFSVLSEHLA
jgi:hypothetical protein